MPVAFADILRQLGKEDTNSEADYIHPFLKLQMTHRFCIADLLVVSIIHLCSGIAIGLLREFGFQTIYHLLLKKVSGIFFNRRKGKITFFRLKSGNEMIISLLSEKVSPL